MERARAAAAAALFAILALSTVALAAVAPRSSAGTTLADVTWPPATLLVSELQTGGASASDEFVEITNAGSVEVDLAGLEVVYVTSTGGTVTRKATWTTTTTLSSGRHLLIANGSGSYASIADAVYSGGFAATGGSIVVRAVGGAPIDAVGWGDATNGFVENSRPRLRPRAEASSAGPGGEFGNTTDTNDNAGRLVRAGHAESAGPRRATRPGAGRLAEPDVAAAPSAASRPRSPSRAPRPRRRRRPRSPLLGRALRAAGRRSPSPTPTSISPAARTDAAPSVSPAPTSTPLPGAASTPTASPTDSPSPSPTAGRPEPGPSPSPS